MKSLTRNSAIALTALFFSSISINAQTSALPASCSRVYRSNPNIVLKAQNLARQAAEKVNGGLRNYRAEDSMFPPSTNAPCKDNSNGTLTFSFTGHKPGSSVPFVKSVVTVNTKTWQASVDYNGSPKSHG